MPRRGIAVAVIVIVACFIVLGLTSDFLVDWAWFSAIGYLDVFGTILGGKAVLFFAVFAGSAILLWVNGSLASRFARRRGHVHPVGFAQEAGGVQTLPELLELMRQVNCSIPSHRPTGPAIGRGVMLYDRKEKWEDEKPTSTHSTKHASNGQTRHLRSVSRC